MSFEPCAYEDSENCYWNAPTMGDGNGDSFINVNGSLTYIEGCALGQGLPAVDQAEDGTYWAYCEPALGNAMPSCEPGQIVAEDLSCVNPEFYAEPVEEAPVTEYTETVVVPIEDQPTELAATGPEDFDALTLAVAGVLIVAGAVLVALGRRARAQR